MITLFTGLPGNGKTLFALWYIAAKAKKENREVYYHNIKDLNGEKVGNWTEFEPTKWQELPKGAIIVIDECQDVFPRKPNGAQMPDHYQALSVHRHSGFDIFLITQHPTLIDNFARRLVGQHFHSVRKFGLQRATIYEWSACNPGPETPSSQKSAVSLKWKFKKEVYSWYKSAEVHTVKRAIPAKLVLGVLFVFSIIGGGYYALDSYQHRYDTKPSAAVVQAGGSGGALVAGGAVSPAGVPGRVDPVEDAKQYVWKETPRVVGQQSSAPKYDALTAPKRVPVPAMCVQVGSVTQSSRQVSCRCYSQQGTPMDVAFNQCIDIARNGYFQEFDPDPDRAQLAQAGSDAGRVPPAGDRIVAQASPSVTMIPDIGDRPVRQVRVAEGSILGK